MWHAEALLTNFKGKDWDVNKSSDLKILIRHSHTHIFLLPTKSRGEAKDWEKAGKIFFVRPAPNNTPPPPYPSVWMTGPTPTFLKIWICHCRGRSTLTFVHKMNELSHLKWIQPGLWSSGELGRGKSEKACRQTFGTAFPRNPLCIRSWCKLLLVRTLTVDRSDWHLLFGQHVARNLITKWL